MEKPAILVLDDEKDICIFTKKILENKGFEVFTAFTGASAMKILKSLRVDIAILDIYLTGKITGMDVLKFIKKTGYNCLTIMITKESDIAVMDEAKKFGAANYMTKPIAVKELTAVVEKLRKRLKRGVK